MFRRRSHKLLAAVVIIFSCLHASGSQNLRRSTQAVRTISNASLHASRSQNRSRSTQATVVDDPELQNFCFANFDHICESPMPYYPTDQWRDGVCRTVCAMGWVVVQSAAQRNAWQWGAGYISTFSEDCGWGPWNRGSYRCQQRSQATCTCNNHVALTFDDGDPASEVARRIVSRLAKYNAKGTFFVSNWGMSGSLDLPWSDETDTCNNPVPLERVREPYTGLLYRRFDCGRNVDRKKRVQQFIAAGIEIGTHTSTHNCNDYGNKFPEGSLLTPEYFEGEINDQKSRMVSLTDFWPRVHRSACMKGVTATQAGGAPPGYSAALAEGLARAGYSQPLANDYMGRPSDQEMSEGRRRGPLPLQPYAFDSSDTVESATNLAQVYADYLTAKTNGVEPILMHWKKNCFGGATDGLLTEVFVEKLLQLMEDTPWKFVTMSECYNPNARC